jgi:hypothetical protein
MKGKDIFSPLLNLSAYKKCIAIDGQTIKQHIYHEATAS